MKGDLAFSPHTGHDLGSERHRPGELHEAPQLEAQTGSGELVLGGRRSNREALAQHFARSYVKSHYGQKPSPEIKRVTAYGLYALKRASNPPDDRVWLALTEYLARNGFWAVWMLNHVDVTCPRCGSLCKWEPRLTGYDILKCGVNCGKDGYRDRSFEIVERVKDLYYTAFGEEIEELVIV